MYSHEPENYACPFCRIVQGVDVADLATKPTDIVYHNDQLTAFLSLHQLPKNPGNTLVVPNLHFENIYEIPVLWLCRVQALGQAIALAMKTVYACDGVSLRQHNEPAGNQDVWHYHVHVTPRFAGDHFYANYATAKVMMPEAERAAHAARLRAQLAGWQPPE